MGGGERERERERQTDRQRKRWGERESDLERERERERVGVWEFKLGSDHLQPSEYTSGGWYGGTAPRYRSQVITLPDQLTIAVGDEVELEGGAVVLMKYFLHPV